MLLNYNFIYGRFWYPKLKNFDLFYKTNQNFSGNCFKKRGKVNLSIVFRDTKLFPRTGISIFGFGLQFFFSVFAFYTFNFGFKTKVKFNCFVMDKCTFFNNVSFFLFLNFPDKVVSMGLFSKSFSNSSSLLVSKFFISDLFNFFGAKFFSKFYVDFFDWPAKFVFSYAISNYTFNKKFIPVFFSIFKVY